MRLSQIIAEIDRKRAMLWEMRRREIDSRNKRSKEGMVSKVVFSVMMVLMSIGFGIGSYFSGEVLRLKIALAAISVIFMLVFIFNMIKKYKERNKPYLDRWETSIAISLMKYQSKDDDARAEIISHIIGKKLFRDEKQQLFMKWRKKERASLARSRRYAVELISEFNDKITKNN